MVFSLSCATSVVRKFMVWLLSRFVLGLVGIAFGPDYGFYRVGVEPISGLRLFSYKVTQK